MRQDWVEFEIRDEKKVSLRLEYITSIIEKEGYVWLCYDEKPFLDGDQKLASFYHIAEPYEQVKQKIIDAEKVDYNNVVVEHFTREEYENLRYYAQFYKENNTWDDDEDRNLTDKMLNKLDKILKEDK